MATIIPKDLPNFKSSREVAVFFRTLKKLGDDFTVRLSLAPAGESRPHFFVIYRNRFAFLIQVAETSQQLAESAIQSDFLSTETQLTPDALGSNEAGVLRKFVASVEEELGPLPAPGLPLRQLVVFPNVSQNTVDEIDLQRSRKTDTRFLGLNQLPVSAFEDRLRTLAERSLPEPALLHLRRAFDPGSVVPAAFSPIVVRERDNSARLTSSLLDLDQEWCVKNDLYLPPQQQRIADETTYRTQLVTGVAGCGKSLVLLYRALLSAELNPNARILVLTHNNPLRSELERRFDILNKKRLSIEYRTFFQWAAEHLGNWTETTLYPKQCEEIIARLKDSHPELHNHNPAYVWEEICWIKDLNIRNLTAYLEADRTGRGKSLPREAIWKLFVAYQKELNAINSIDWAGVAMRFHQQAVTEAKLGFPHYDFIFVDEAQFFAKSWFEVVRTALKPGGHLFLAADPTQGFLRRRQSWLASGIDVRGKTTRLRQPYRNSRAVLHFAANFYQTRAEIAPETHRDDDLNIPTKKQIETVKIAGSPPEFIVAASEHDELLRAANEVSALHRERQAGGQVLLLLGDSRLSRQLHQVLVQSLGDGSLVHNAKEGPLPPGAFCQYTTMNAATGLEAAIVFVLGLDFLLESENDPRLNPEERSERLRDHTRQLYMAFTRAGQRLVITCRSPETKCFLQAVEQSETRGSR